MNTKAGCLESLIACCLAGGIVWSVLLLSFGPFLIGMAAGFSLAALANCVMYVDRRLMAGRRGRRSAHGSSDSVKLIRKDTRGLWVEVPGEIYHVPFSLYPALATLQTADLCDVELLNGRYLFWPKTRQNVPLYSLQAVSRPRPSVYWTGGDN